MKLLLLLAAVVLVFNRAVVSNMDACTTHSGYRGWKSGDKCVFPFYVGGTAHYSCTTLIGYTPGCCTGPGDVRTCPWGRCDNPNTCRYVASPPPPPPPPPSLPTTGFPSGDFQIKHEASGLCIGNYGGETPVLWTCVRGARGQMWFRDGQYIKNRQYTNRGLKVGVVRARSSSRSGELAEVKMGILHRYKKQDQWKYENKYLVNLYKQSRLVPSAGRYIQSGRQRSLLGVVSSYRGETNYQRNLMKWILVRA